MVDLSSLLQIWDLEGDDKAVTLLESPGDVSAFPTVDGRDQPIDQPIASLPQVTSISSQAEVPQKHCDRCHASNILIANWCIECGGAFVPDASLPGDQFPEVKQKSLVSQKHENAVYAECNDTSVCVMGSSLHNSQLWDDVAFPSTPEDAPIKILQCSNRIVDIATPKRHWETSKSYAWRKPRSTAKQTTCRSAEWLPIVTAAQIMERVSRSHTWHDFYY